MASYKEDRNSFTRSGLGKGPSEGLKREKIGRGQTLLSAYPQDNVTYDLPDEHGGKVGGSPTNLRDQLSGASAVQDTVGGHKSRISGGE
jgi:hypothetical protein